MPSSDVSEQRAVPTFFDVISYAVLIVVTVMWAVGYAVSLFRNVAMDASVHALLSTVVGAVLVGRGLVSKRKEKNGGRHREDAPEDN